jgi:hypothetical protein
VKRSTLLIQRKETVVLADRRNEQEIAVWAREWNERSAHLVELVGEIDRGSLGPAVALLQEVRECRRQLAAPPALELRSRWRFALDEIWEAACSTLYGDLEPARQHVDAALRNVREMDSILEVWTHRSWARR